MALLEMRGAEFSALRERYGPYDIAVEDGERRAIAASGGREASIVALLAAGIVKATSGRVFVAEFDPRIQPVHVRRSVGFVPHDAVAMEFADFEGYIAFRAALWNLDSRAALVRGRDLLERFPDVHEAFAYPLVGALLAEPRLLVLDRPQSAFARDICALCSAGTAVFSTHATQREAQRFSDACATMPL